MLYLATAAALAMSTGAVPAFALAGAGESLVVTTRDLDLTVAEGVDKLDQRIRSAIRLACPRLDTVNLRQRRLAWACRHETARQAQAQRDILIAAARESRRRVAAVRH